MRLPEGMMEGWRKHRRGVALGVLAGTLLVSACVFAYYYARFGRLIDEKLSGQIFQNTSRVYSRPERIYTGEALGEGELKDHLLRAGYTGKEAAGSPGWYRELRSILRGNRISREEMRCA